MPLRLVYTPDALADLRSILSHIAGDNPSAARTFVGAIERRCRDLCQQPHLGRAREDLGIGLRIVPFRRRIVIAYRIEDNDLAILRVFYGGRDYEALLGGHTGSADDV
ncbi:MAG TPA: type II toxin-antitoxin system RelE/ParE family toxin [Inquilinus sp.]|uniref:type II toxin-antitoxin system RelE/ParE family toxin n=1 Tax=Inquilinus sp. TaxID=1932117 RepID=UPI002FA48DD3